MKKTLLLFIITALGLCHCVEFSAQVNKKPVIRKTGNQVRITSKEIVEKDGYVWIQAKQGKKYGAKTPEGKVIVPLEYDTVEYRSQPAQFIVKKGGYKGGYLTNGKCAINTERRYNGVAFMYNAGVNYWIIMNDTGCGITDKDGNLVIEPERGYGLCSFQESDGVKYILIQSKSGLTEQYGICNINGQELISPNRGYSWCQIIRQGTGEPFIQVSKGDNKGLCNMNGNELISPNLGYTYCSVISNGQVKVKKGGEYLEIALPQSSSSSSKISSSSLSSETRYSGNYTRSSQGRNVKTGQYTDAMGSDWQINVVFYDDYILVNGERYNYWGTTNGVKSYMRDDFTGARNIYNVDANYNLQYFSARSNPYTGDYDMWSYEVRKGNTSIPVIPNNSVNTISPSNPIQATTPSSNAGSSKMKQEPTPRYGYTQCPRCQGSKKCQNCHGTGMQDKGLGLGRIPCGVCYNHDGKCTFCLGKGVKYGRLN